MNTQKKYLFSINIGNGDDIPDYDPPCDDEPPPDGNGEH